MTTPDRSLFTDTPIPEASEADVAEQQIPVGDADDESWSDAATVNADRGWKADEADLIEQANAVPEDDSEYER